MINFLTSNELKKLYKVYANFYMLKQSNDTNFICRNVADIFKLSNKSANPDSLPDAIVIMMNPGSCEPINSLEDIKFSSLHDLEVRSKTIPKTLCKPDNAQYQIMRLMYHKNWNHIRILNLSDIKCSSGDNFKALLKQLQASDKKHTHSIFSDERVTE